MKMFLAQAAADGQLGNLGGVFSWPCFHPSFNDADWMHCADLGVLSNTLGNCIWEIVGANGG